MTLDPNLAALLTEEISYQPKIGVDKHAQDVWGDAVTLKCYPAFGAQQIQKADGTLYDSEMALYFDASDPIVQGFQLGDRFTAPGIAGGQTQEAERIEPNYSPGPRLGDPMKAWLIEVSL